MLDQRQQIALQPHQDRLRLRIAQAAVELERLELTRAGDHQTGIQETGVGLAFGLHAPHHRLDHFAHGLGVQRRRQHRRRRVCAHAAGIGPAIGVEQALVILAGGERQHVAAVDHDDEARLLAVEKSSMTTRAPAAPTRLSDQHVVDGSVRFLQQSSRRRHPCRPRAIRLDDDRCAVRIDVCVRGLRLAEGLDARRSECRAGP